LTPLKDSLPCHPFVKNWANQAAVNEKKRKFFERKGSGENQSRTGKSLWDKI